MSNTNEPVKTATDNDDLDYIKEDLDLLLRYQTDMTAKTGRVFNFGLTDL